MRYLIALAIVIFGYTCLFAQKQTQIVQQIWLAYFNQTRLTDKWGLWADLHIRTKEDFLTDFSTGIARIGLTYYVHDDLRLTAGYGYINLFPGDDHPGVSRPEHRPWQQVQWVSAGRSSRITQFVRLEERFRRKILNQHELDAGYNFNYRWRYNFLLMVPLGKKVFETKSLSFVFNDEIMLNMGKEIVNNYFDQNRFFVGLGYHLARKDILQFGYLNVFQQLAAGNRYKSIHAPRISYFHNLDLRKK